MKNILLFSTSVRSGSFNAMLITFIASILGNDIEKKIINLNTYDMPIYNGDFEKSQGMPNDVKRLYDEFDKANGIIISTAEYNSSYPALVKNAVDWVSRINKKCFHNKAILVVSASLSPMGGAYASFMLKNLFMYLGGIVIPSKFYVPVANTAFNESGELKNADSKQELSMLIDHFLHVTKNL